MASSKEFTITGTDAIERKLKAFAKKEEGKIGPALFKKAHKILADSQLNYVPVGFKKEVGTGALRASGNVSEPKGKWAHVEVTISYGGPASAYALAIHEHPSSHSPPSWRGKNINWAKAGTGPKYLELPFRKAEPTLLRDLAKDLGIV